MKNLWTKRPSPVARIAINLKPRSGSWGGANQWTSQLSRFLEFCGYEVVYRLDDKVDCIVMTHAGLSDAIEFGAQEVTAFKARKNIPCLHRINDNDIRKNSDAMDRHLAASDEAADHTIFVSEWLRDYHAGKWFDHRRPHSVIAPGANPGVFHPIGNPTWKQGQPFRLVTHHWSSNMAKGFDVYRAIDQAMAAGKLPGIELWIIGRWPEEITWQATRTFGPHSGPDLANLLRQCHGYISASRHEPGAMHVAEGLQCGLPLLYHPETGGTVETGRALGFELQENLGESIRGFQAAYPELRAKLLAAPPSGDVMCLQYRRLIQRLLAER